MKGYIKTIQKLVGRLSVPINRGTNSIEITNDVVLYCDGLVLTTSIIGELESEEEENGI